MRGEKKISLDIYEARSSVFYMHNHKMIPETNKISNSKKKKNYWSPQSGNYKLIWFFFLKSLLLEPPSTVIIRIRYQPFYFAFPIAECRRPTFVYIYNTLNQDNDKWHAFFVVVFSFRNNKYLKCSSGRQSKYAKRCWIYPKN